MLGTDSPHPITTPGPGGYRQGVEDSRCARGRPVAPRRQPHSCHGAVLEGASFHGPAGDRNSLGPHGAGPHPGGGHQHPAARRHKVWDCARRRLFPHLSLCVPVASRQGEGHGFGQPGPGLPGGSSSPLEPPCHHGHQLLGPALQDPAREKLLPQAGESLKGCLEEALALIPENQYRGTPLFLGATAGMRLLSQKNSSQAGDILAAVSGVLGQSPLDFWGAEVLAGQDEGAFAWITINYVLGRLVKYSSGEWIQPAEGTLVGALDMGGASTQISFLPRGPILDESTRATLRLYGTDYSIYTHSYLCFGRDQMLNRLLAALVQSSPGALLRHPCYLSGFQTTLPLASLYESPCVHMAAQLGLTQNLTVEGTGNPGACLAAIRELFNFSSCEGSGDCAFNGVYQPPVQGQFYAFSNFYYTFHFLNLTSRQPLRTVNATIWEFCQRPWRLVGGRQLPGAGALAAGLLRFQPVHPHAAGGLWVQ
ncbi:ectonucleoside triphosphate diphosphohydrolase 8 isoform X5 [Marmota marmota marmota]|uniref:ectonucleoside triphosphate diphosphohydrolase 8 isoform X5 n=1 Tax=Marmota marmota marmota TaxID=9994 RepID=UPI00209364F0|nr:ectonucleoside triphosphate diphosphohydrolase 8 isoform X5 [Marmota marmota marmota]